MRQRTEHHLVAFQDRLLKLQSYNPYCQLQSRQASFIESEVELFSLEALQNLRRLNHHVFIKF